MITANVKAPNVAGRFYAADPEQLQVYIKRLLQAANGDSTSLPKAIIVPHAGYIYSGEIAANAYAELAANASVIRRVVLLGPPHYHPVRGVAAPEADGFQTPLGTVPVDKAAISIALGLPFVRRQAVAFEREHSLETQLPFLQSILPKFSVVPLLVGNVSPPLIGTLLERLWGGSETLIVVSSDLSHYLDYDSACAIDKRTCTAIEALNTDMIDHDQACGRYAVNGLLYTARRRRLTVRTLDLRNSGDTAGSRDRVVGYGAWVFQEPAESSLSMADRRILLGTAANSIRHGLDHSSPLPVVADDYPERLRQQRACFVTLKWQGRLRGCIGSLVATRTLIKDVADNAYAAAFSDPRFQPVNDAEIEQLALNLSVLSQPQPLKVGSREQLLARLRPGIDGLILQDDQRRATFLPSVWEDTSQPERFVAALLRKGGWSPDYWSEELRVHTYTTESFS